MNVYDFDKTILCADSTEKFYFHCLKKYPSMLKHVPATLAAFIGFRLGIRTKKYFKEVLFRFLRCVPDIDREIEEFWDKNEKMVFDWYRKAHKEDDVVISASPEFLIVPICTRLGIKNAMASRVDKKSGLYTGENCYGEEKVKRFYERFGKVGIDMFCSDSLSDTPLALLAKEKYIISKKGELLCWDEFAEGKIKR